MRIKMNFIIGFTFIFFVVGLIISWFYIMPLGYDVLDNEIFLQFSDIVETRASFVNDFLNERKEGLVSFSKNELFKDFLENPEKRDSLFADVTDVVLHEKRSSEFFDEFFVLLPNGDILINTQEGYTPQDIFREFDFSNEKEGEAYIKPLRFCYCLRKYVLDITTPIYNDNTNEFMGLVVARIYIDNLRDIAWGDYALEDLEKVYLISSQGILISFSEFSREGYGRFTQNVDNENARKCFSMDFDDEHIGHDAFSGPFLNYLGDEVVGIHKYLSEPDWCILVEADISILEDPKRSIFMKNLFMSVVLVLAFTLIGYYISVSFNEKRGGKDDRRKTSR